MKIKVKTSSIIESLFPSVPLWRILKYLRSFPAGATGREIARGSGLSHPTAHRELKRLAAAGVVLSQSRGKAIVYSLDQDHFLYRRLLLPSLDDTELYKQELMECLPQGLFSTGKPISMILFGSRARGDAAQGSDWDLLGLVKSKGQKAALEQCLREAAAEFERRTRTMLSPLVLTLEQYRQGIRRGDNLVMSIHRDGKVIYGRSKTEIVAHD